MTATRRMNAAIGSAASGEVVGTLRERGENFVGGAVNTDRELLQGGVNLIAHFDVFHRSRGVNRFARFDDRAESS